MKHLPFDQDFGIASKNFSSRRLILNFKVERNCQKKLNGMISLSGCCSTVAWTLFRPSIYQDASEQRNRLKYFQFLFPIGSIRRLPYNSKEIANVSFAFSIVRLRARTSRAVFTREYLSLVGKSFNQVEHQSMQDILIDTTAREIYQDLYCNESKVMFYSPQFASL